MTTIKIKVNKYQLGGIGCTNILPTFLPPQKRIIAIGDIHGDLQMAKNAFMTANLMDKNENWIAEPPNTIVVQVGDQIDSCRPPYCDNEDVANDINVMNFFDEMNAKAIKKGGAVYSLLGNHELMNSLGYMDYASKSNKNDFEYENMKGEDGRKNAFKPGGIVANKMACTRNSVMVIGSTIFAHAGVLPLLLNEYVNAIPTDTKTKQKYFNTTFINWLEHLNETIREWLLKNKTSKYAEMLINDEKKSLFWQRIFGEIGENKSLNDNECVEIKKFIDMEKTIKIDNKIQIYNIGQMVVGHTPSNNGNIYGTCHKGNGVNSLFKIDGAYSYAFNPWKNNKQYNVQVLEIIDDKDFKILGKKN
jgi:hypothetical protein